MRNMFASVAALSLAASCAHGGSTPPIVEAAAPEGLIVIESAHPVAETAQRFADALAEREIKAFEIDHAANAQSVSLSLAPTILLIFGSPVAGTPLIQAAPTAAIDLPMKALFFERDGKSMIAYNDVDYIAARHGVPADAPSLAKMRGLLKSLAAKASGN